MTIHVVTPATLRLTLIPPSLFSPTLCSNTHCAAWLECCHLHDTYGPLNYVGIYSRRNPFSACIVSVDNCSITCREDLHFLHFYNDKSSFCVTTVVQCFPLSLQECPFPCVCYPNLGGTLYHTRYPDLQLWSFVNSTVLYNTWRNSHHGHRTMSLACGRLLASRVHSIQSPFCQLYSRWYFSYITPPEYVMCLITYMASTAAKPVTPISFCSVP